MITDDTTNNPPAKLPLSKGHMEAIGLVSAHWTYLESVIEIGIWGLLAISQLKGRAVTTHIGTITRLDILRTLAPNYLDPNHLDTEAITNLDLLIKRFEEVRIERNKIVHATWIDLGDPDIAHATKHSAKRGLKMSIYFLQESDIRETAQEIAQLNADFRAFLEQHSLVPDDADQIFALPESWLDKFQEPDQTD